MPLPLLSSLSRVSLFANPSARSSGASLSTVDGRQLALVGARLRGDARGGIARLVLEQRFENPFAETLDVTYRMPLPADGAVSAYAFEIGGRIIAGRVDKKAAARETFERALVEGRTAALLEQNTNDIFTQQIGNLPPNETLVARITVDQRLAWLPEGEWELRFPTVIGPRYISPGDREQDARDTHVAVAPDGVAAGIQIAITIGDTIAGGRRASSPTHTLVHRANGSIELKDAAALDRDIVVRWPVAGARCGLALDACRRANGDAFGLLTIVPPAATSKPTAIARDLIVLLDTSGSMGGGPLDKGKLAVAMLIETLGEQDRLELIEFSNAPRRYKRAPVVATAREKQEAIKWVRSRQADGGTEMASAIHEAMHALRPGAQRQVVLVTDGYVGGEQRVIQQCHDDLPASCRLHVVGVGSAVNRSLATALARAGRGTEVLIALDEDVERAMKRMVDRTRMPVLTNVTISGTGFVRQAPEYLPDVYEGSPIVAALQVEPEGGELVVRGELAREPWEQRIRVPGRAVGDGNQAIAALYAREHVADLETRWAIGDHGFIDREIELTGVEFQIATRLTSWVAVDMVRRVDKIGPSRHQNVPQALPYGTSARSFGLRAASAMATEDDERIGAADLSADAPDLEDLEELAVLGPPRAAAQKTLTLGVYEDSGDGYLGAPPAEEGFAGEAPTGQFGLEQKLEAPSRSVAAPEAAPAQAPKQRRMQGMAPLGKSSLREQPSVLGKPSVRKAGRRASWIWFAMIVLAILVGLLLRWLVR